ncbi:hypothetical protein Tsubulata_033970 [Turnera subulata]|uniref:C2H2-type domain-containing protein n=1 Tax=Turnera subulata TaxID=218843 RepID=A0A9Q0FI90_9ROSI|nr:hypothetical protein Tsubulata_033970 [Turnera subulata]
MAGKWDLGMPKNGATSLKEQLLRTTLHRVRSQGHPYVELREDGSGKRLIFFCTLCLAPCFSDSVLLDHLKGNLHTERLATARATLLKDNPWPFSDGIHLFGTLSESEKQGQIMNGGKSKWLASEKDCDSLAVVKYDGNSKNGGDKKVGCVKNDRPRELVIPGVHVDDELIADLGVSYIGSGLIAARYREKCEGANEIIRIWCEWLGEKSPAIEGSTKGWDHSFGIITFPYQCDLGRKGLFDDVKLLLSSPQTESENDEGNSRKRQKAFSDPGDLSHSSSPRNDSSGEESSSASNGASSRLLLDRFDDQLLHTRFISSKVIRREVRKQQRIAAEKMCDICQQKMLPGKDVATLVNMKTGKLACSSRNLKGNFHVFHTSCLVHWVLLCELEMSKNESSCPKVRRRCGRKNGTKYNTRGKNGKLMVLLNRITSVFCPECQGTGRNIEGNELEDPTILLSEMFKLKIKVSDGHRAWMKSPEMLENCSIGFHLPSQSEEAVEEKEKVLPLKLLHFYRAE